jgi:hypothetical protein
MVTLALENMDGVVEDIHMNAEETVEGILIQMNVEETVGTDRS